MEKKYPPYVGLLEFLGGTQDMLILGLWFLSLNDHASKTIFHYVTLHKTYFGANLLQISKLIVSVQTPVKVSRLMSMFRMFSTSTKWLYDAIKWSSFDFHMWKLAYLEHSPDTGCRLI